jgi:hypothetical protein
MMMDSTKTTNIVVYPDETWVFRIGGVAALAIGVLYLIIIALYVSVGMPPQGGQARLEYLAGKTTAWWAIVGVSVLTNFLYVPVALSLYCALRRVNRFAMYLAVAFVGLFVVLENAVNWTGYGALILLSKGYASVPSETQKAAFVAAATYVSAVLESPLAAVWAIGTLSAGVLVIGIVMLKAAFGKLTAYVGIVAGIFGIAAVAGIGKAIILNALATTVWLFLVGCRLFRLPE